MIELFSARVGCSLTHGSGWFVPLLMRADWPLARLAVSGKLIQVSLFKIKKIEVPWSSVKAIRPIWCGMAVDYTLDEPHEFELMAPFLWSRFQVCIAKHSLAVPTKAEAESS